MKQKIVIKVKMDCEKCRVKAMKIAVKEDGVTKVEVQGSEKDQLVVIGDGVDPAKLTCSLRKEFRCVTILSVGEEKEKPVDGKTEKGKPKPVDGKTEKAKPVDGNPEKVPIPIPARCYWECPPRCYWEVVACEPNPIACSIL